MMKTRCNAKTARRTAVAALLLTGLASLPEATAAPLKKAAASSARSAAKARSTAKDRSEVSITVYNQDFGLVREVRKVQLGKGKVELAFQDVASKIQPETVVVRALGAAGGLEVLEQNYRFDLLTPSTLLEKYVGKSIKIYRYNEQRGRDELYDAKVLSYVSGQPVLEVGGEVTYGFGGRFAFPRVPDNLMSKPTLMWLLDSARGEQQLEVSYLTGGLNWKADYVLVVNENDRAGDLTGWVTLDNRSGTSYENAKLKLVAGDVQRVMERRLARGYTAGMSRFKSAKREAFKEESFFEYHLYSLDRPTTVLDKEKKQVSLLEARGAKLNKKLIFHGAQHYYRGRHGQVQSNEKVGVYLDLTNTKANGLGMPLPKGIVRVYKADKSGSKQFIGEDRIDHTPRGERVRVKMGEAFDVIGERKQTNYRLISRCLVETSWELELRNHKDAATKVEVFEPIGGDWSMLKSSHPHKKRDAHTFTFDVKVPARGKTKISYQVRVRWC